jgi:Mrp family chromosome partitioning ATPase
MALLLPGPSCFGTAAASGAAAGSSSSSLEEAGSKVLSQLLPLLQSKLGVEPPALVKLIKVLLTGHKGWFKVQRCQDPFAAALGLDRLLQAESAAAAGIADGIVASAVVAAGVGSAGVAANAAAAAAGTGASREPNAAGGAVSDGEMQDQPPGLIDADMTGSEDAEQLDFDEAEVLQVMEVLELPRATALELLAEQGGDAQAVITQAFGA